MVEYSGYDFGYFVKLLTAVSLPRSEDEFFELLRIWFPTVYDIKFMMRASQVLKGGLQEVADDLGVCGHYNGLPPQSYPPTSRSSVLVTPTQLDPTLC